MRSKLTLFPLLIGLLISGTAVFAETLGLDHSPGWGRGRIAILIIGISFILYSVFYYRYKNKILHATHNIQSFVSQGRCHQTILHLSKLFKNYWLTLPVFILVILVYIWFASSGSWTNWDSPTRFYAELANGFRHGKLYLLIRPDPDLLNLPNPYDPLTRKGVEFPIDNSLYKGRFYLYWGPAPALILVAISPLIHGKVGDLYLVFGFLCGIFLFQYILVLSVWDRFFNQLPRWMLLSSILVMGLCIPSTFILNNEPNGRIYEAAIAGGQFFLMAGCLITLIDLGNSYPSGSQLVFAGILWALAIGTRLLLIFPVGFMVLMIAYQIFKSSNLSFTNYIVKLIPLGLPLILCFIGLGWYNWARFGSVTETGYSYQLAGVNLQKYHNDLFSPIYIIQNLYNYFLHPPVVITQFPFVSAEKGYEQALFQFYSLPAVYATSPVTGLLYISPFLLFAFTPIVVRRMKTALIVSSGMRLENDKGSDLLNWIVTSLFGTFLSAFIMLVVFFWAAMRYMEDFMPAITLISVIGFWQGYQLFAQKSFTRRIYSIVGIIMAGATIVISTLMSLSVMHFRP